MERHGVAADAAFSVLSRVSQAENMKLAEIARRFVETGELRACRAQRPLARCADAVARRRAYAAPGRARQAEYPPDPERRHPGRNPRPGRCRKRADTATTLCPSGSRTDRGSGRPQPAAATVHSHCSSVVTGQRSACGVALRAARRDTAVTVESAWCSAFAVRVDGSRRSAASARRCTSAWVSGRPIASSNQIRRAWRKTPTCSGSLRRLPRRALARPALPGLTTSRAAGRSTRNGDPAYGTCVGLDNGFEDPPRRRR